jgi:hypothetical protein
MATRLILLVDEELAVFSDRTTTSELLSVAIIMPTASALRKRNAFLGSIT